MIPITRDCALNENELTLSFVRSGGPGGQNVNKVSTAAQLRFNIPSSPSLTEDAKERLIAIAGTRVNSKGDIIIHASNFRSQERNRAEAIERLASLIRRALHVPRKRKKTMPTFSSRKRRTASKKLLGEKKKSRRLSSRDFE
jgi:ribosome-associated protein